MKFLLRTFLLLALSLALLAGGFHGWLKQPLRLPADNVEFRIPAGTGLRGVVRILDQAGVKVQGELLVLAARLSGKEGSIRAGTYGIAAGTTPEALLDALVEGKVLQVEVRLIEGWTFRQWRSLLTAHQGLEHVTTALDERDLMQKLGFPDIAPEGMFFPDTYRVDKYSTDLELLSQAARAMQRHLEREWAGREPGLPYRTPYEALIMASLVEKETGVAADREMVAGVFVNRLRSGMRLQTDPAVIYGLGERFDGNLRKVDLQTDTPFNTYTRTGLPPTPIAMPGLAALQAALHPARTGAFYFVARGDGSSHFSRTLDEHEQAVNRYQRRAR
ncbi:MAG: endolytic transglycosylase MltG [Azovibrio sp.]|uniref:endolytic transglycosylase MltG n=1 Tax=Azovibrio sp. TaxID=1872673 RepID=UPI003C77C8AF